MKALIACSMIALMVMSGVAVAQETAITAYWHQHHTVQHTYLAQGQGTLTQHQLRRHHMVTPSTSWMVGLKHSQLIKSSGSHYQAQSTPQHFHEWMLGFAWHGMIETRLWLARGDDAIQRKYGNDTRMMLGVEKTFGF